MNSSENFGESATVDVGYDAGNSIINAYEFPSDRRSAVAAATLKGYWYLVHWTKPERKYGIPAEASIVPSFLQQYGCDPA